MLDKANAGEPLAPVAKKAMSHFGVLSYKGTGHLNPLIALSRKLVDRGHRVTFFQSSALEQKIRQQGLEFCAIGECNSSPGRRDKPSSRLAAICNGVDRIAGDMETFLRVLPAAICNTGVDALVVGEIALSGPTVAEMLHLPYFIVSTSIPHNFGWDAPRSIVARGSWLERLQREILEVSVLRMRGPVCRRLDQYRMQIGLGPTREIQKTYPELAHITQIPQCFDLPRPSLPESFFYTGPFIEERTRASIGFPWDLLDGRPLIYASLGTTRKNDPMIFHRVAEACRSLNVQLVISLGGRRDPASFADLPGNPLVVSNAPQLELLKKAEIVITHAGPNTVLETLMEGKPMVALPMVLDQPAVAARLERLGAAEVLSIENRSTQQIHTAIMKVQNDPGYWGAAQKLQAQMRSILGLERAADIMEEALRRRASRTSSGQHLDDIRLTRN
ncbi:glycosyltransferase [Terriglobus saanensis]|uniref:Glycosyltransferase, MGT family n=1 Tax=Terriglobus saanensis (strain ATCC BAA-1853 / DSM 23119 / SP1PR4) TaxID=401053 RepID=E8V148_TERSS|nr:nucleotide disphospho-sugar-binding domain-containing protein [Terriglobus saanensis]ADV83396.1 glycosyltransferase, MGT family [Terriglobus saanensis SP1PR4]